MINRYLNRRIVLNDASMYEEYFFDRGLKFVNQYETPKFVYPDETTIRTITMIEHVWKVGDRYYKLAQRFYGNPREWWIIAKFNNKPTEAHVKYGETILIPTPLEQVLNIMK